MSGATKQVLKIVLILIIIAVFVLSYIDVGGLRRQPQAPVQEGNVNPTSPPSTVGPSSSPRG